MLPSRFATARSWSPSPSKSELITARGLGPTGSDERTKPPEPSLRMTETDALPKFGTARSGRPSPFTSVTASVKGLVPTG